jgi:rubrerythrin
MNDELKAKKDIEKIAKGGVKLRCKKCGYTWIYGGENPYWATCPRCHTMVKVSE